ncbi:MAG TPA: TonB-dependent siderophore receptor [Stellaceae bacterium]|nr:TonB-dependent siderophore receptor [Stellaceae bacterium]
MALAGGITPGLAQSANGDGMALPTISVQGNTTSNTGDYKMDQPTLPKLTEPLLNTPQTIDVVPRQLMDDQGVTTFRDALRNVPGISLAAGEGASQGDNLTIRGFTARNDIYLDGMRDFGSYYRDPFFLEDIQVLKGPASILFGRGSTGGVVEQDSKLPKLDPFYTGTAVLGTDLTKRLTADVNQPLPQLGEGAALRINLMGQDNYFADRNVAENSRFGLAPSLALGLGTPTRITLSYLHQSEYDIPDYGLPWVYSAPSGSLPQIARPAPLSLTQSNYYGFENGNYLRTNVDVATAKIEHDFDKNLTISDQFRYAHYVRQFDITEPQLFTPASTSTPGAAGVALLVPPGTPLATLNVARNQLYGHSLETYLVNDLDATSRFSTGFADHTLRGGLEIGRETSDPVRYGNFAPYSLTPLLDPNPNVPNNANTFLSSRTNTSARTIAVYALDTIKLNEQWELMGGLRWDRFAADYDQITFANPVTGAGAGGSAFSRTDYNLSWRGAIVYKPVPYGSIYFDAGTSFDPSAEALSLSSATAPLPPVKNRSFELGDKWDLFDANLSVSSALFYTNQYNVREPDPNNSLVNILAGDAVAKGGEIQAAGHITENWQVLAGYAYTYAVIDSSPVSGPASDLGHRLANTPAHTANLWTEYYTPWKIELGAGINVVSSRFAATTPTTAGGVAFFKEVPAYWTLSAMAKYPIDEHWTAQVNLYNLTDNKFYDQLHPAHVVPGAGTTALFTLAFKY